MFFLRQIEVSIGDVILSGELQNLRIEFDVRKDLSNDIITSEILVYNLSEQVRNLIRRLDDPVFLRAGYEEGDGLKTVFIGEITGIKHTADLPNIITRIDASDSYRRLRESRDEISFGAGTSAMNVLNTIVSKFNLNVREFNFSLDGEYIGGFSMSGTLREALDKITEKFDLEWSVQNQEIQILQRGGLTPAPGVIVSYQNGLLSKPERLNENTSDPEGRDRPPGFEVRMFLNPDMEPGGLAIMQDGPAPGNYRIGSVRHIGTNKQGEFVTTANLFEV